MFPPDKGAEIEFRFCPQESQLFQFKSLYATAFEAVKQLKIKSWHLHQAVRCQKENGDEN